MSLLIKNTKFLYFNFFILHKFNCFIISNHFYLYFYLYKFYKFLNYTLFIKHFYLYIFNSLNFFLINFMFKLVNHIFLKLIYIYLGFLHYKFFIKIGLGFRKKIFLTV